MFDEVIDERLANDLFIGIGRQNGVRDLPDRDDRFIALLLCDAHVAHPTIAGGGNDVPCRRIPRVDLRARSGLLDRPDPQQLIARDVGNQRDQIEHGTQLCGKRRCEQIRVPGLRFKDGKGLARIGD